MKLPSPLPRRAHEPLGALIDIVFLLLIFFMLVGALQWPEPLPVKPPSSQASERGAAQQSIVTLAADGRLAFAGQQLDKQALVVMVKRHLAEEPRVTIALKADASTATREVMAVLDALRQAGVKQLSLLTISATPQSP